MKTIIPNLFIKNIMENLDYYQGIFGGHHINESCTLFFGDREKTDKPDGVIHIYVKLETDQEIQEIYDNLKTTSTIGYELHLDISRQERRTEPHSIGLQNVINLPVLTNIPYQIGLQINMKNGIYSHMIPGTAYYPDHYGKMDIIAGWQIVLEEYCGGYAVDGLTVVDWDLKKDCSLLRK